MKPFNKIKHVDDIIITPITNYINFDLLIHMFRKFETNENSSDFFDVSIEHIKDNTNKTIILVKILTFIIVNILLILILFI